MMSTTVPIIDKPEILRVRGAYARYAFGIGCMVAIQGGYRMARGWYYTRLSLSSDLILYFSGNVYFVIVPFFLSFLFCFCCVFILSLELCRCSSDLFLSGRPRTINTTGLATTYIYYWV